MSLLKNKELYIVAGVVAFIALFVYGLGSALTPLVFSAFLAYASLPLIKKLEAKNLSRHQATLIVLVSVFGALGLILLIAIPPLVEELRNAILETPKTLSSALVKIDAFLSEYGVNIPYNKESLLALLSESSEKISAEFVTTGAHFIKNSLANFVSVILALLGLTMVPVFFFYVLADYEHIMQFIYDIVPRSFAPKMNVVLQRLDTILSGYVRGQLLVCFILSALYTLSLFIVGVPFALIIGITTGVLSIIPYVGFSLGFAMAILSVLAHHESLLTLILLIVSYSIVQFVESFIITPKIVGDKVGLEPFEAILFLIIFGNLFGFIGLFVAIPAGAILKYIILGLMESYKKTEFYRS